jgi:sugar diacid utilization regulator
MVTLADVATIAIDNARLYDDQTTAVSQLQEARDALEVQVAVLQRSSALQQRLLTTVLDGGGLGGIARTAAWELDCSVGIYGSDGHILAHHPGRDGPAALPSSLRPAGRPGCCEVRLGGGNRAVAWMHPVVADGDKAGCVCLLPGDNDSAETLKIVGGQVAMACSLSLLRQNAASRARAEALEQVLWDLVQGPGEHRVAARSRAEQMGVTLAGPHRVLYGQLDNFAELAAELGWDTSQTDRARRKVLRTLQQQNTYPGLRLSSMRGDWLVAIAGDLDTRAVRKLVNDLAAAGRQLWPRLRLTWGVSQRHADAFELPRAFGEAKIALSAAHRLGNENVFLYEELGIVRLLLGSGKDPDLRVFIQEVTGPLADYDRGNNGALIRTLRAFFDADCSQKVAAERLFIHHKTLRYRIRRIEELTGLDLSRHDDRMRADMALRLLQVAGTTDDVTAGATG